VVDFHMKRLLTRSSDLGLPAVSKCSVVLYLGVKKKKKRKAFFIADLPLEVFGSFLTQAPT